MQATDLLDPPSKKGAIRAQMWRDALAAHDAGRVRATEARASDYFGPGLGRNGHFGDRVVPKLLSGKGVSVIGSPDAAHSWSYVADVVTTLEVLGADDRALGRAWHVPTLPAMSAQELADEISTAAGHGTAQVKTLPRPLLKVAGAFSRSIREIDEMLYQFTDPFVIDATDTTEMFELAPTPLGDQIQATLDSYRKTGARAQGARMGR